MEQRRHLRVLVLPRRLPPGSRLRLYFRAPERGNSRSWNHLPATVCCDLGAPGTNIQTISVLALALESVGEDSSSTLSWPQFWPRESFGEDSSPTLSWPHFVTRGSWPRFLASREHQRRFFAHALMAAISGLLRASAKISSSTVSWLRPLLVLYSALRPLSYWYANIE